MIAGQSPRRVWQPNPDGQIRTIEEAIHIAQKYGVKIPDDVVFFVDESNELHQDKMACGPRIDLLSGERIHWYDLVHDLTGKLPFRIWSGIPSSDEAIVAVLSHEL